MSANRVPSITISYGMPKSASTFAWMLLKDFHVLAGLPVATLSPAVKGNRSTEDYLEDAVPETFEAIKAEVGEQNVVVKTHARRAMVLGFRQYFPRDFIFIQHRDPREIVLSLIDHGARARAMNIQDFADCKDVESALRVARACIDTMLTWKAEPDAHSISYDELCFDTPTVIDRLQGIYDVEVDKSSLLQRYEDRTRIIQFNKGIQNRWKTDMSAADSDTVLRVCAPYYDVFGHD